MPNTRVYSIIYLKLTHTEFSMWLRGKTVEELIKPVETKALPFISPGSIVNVNQAQSLILDQIQRSELD